MSLCGRREEGGGRLVGVESHWEVGVALQHCHTEEAGRGAVKEDNLWAYIRLYVGSPVL